MLEAIFSWNTLRILMWVLYIPACLGLIGIVLLQKGKGTGFAGAFGMGSGSEAVFGPRAGRSLPVKLTYVMAAVFVVLAFGLSSIESKVSMGAAPELIEEDTEEPATLPNPELQGRLGQAYSEEESTAAPADSESAAAEPAPEEAAAEPAPADSEMAPPEEPEAHTDGTGS